MFGLREKLVLAFGGMLLILLIVSGLGIAVLKQHRNALDKFLYENWRSVEYGQAMVDSVDKLGDMARQFADHAVQVGPASDATLAAVRAAAAPALTKFDENLDLENHNITLPHRGRVGECASRWSGRGPIETARKPPTTTAPRYEALLAPDRSPEQHGGICGNYAAFTAGKD